MEQQTIVVMGHTGYSYRGYLCKGWRNALALVRLVRGYGWRDVSVRGASFRDMHLANHLSGGLAWQVW